MSRTNNPEESRSERRSKMRKQVVYPLLISLLIISGVIGGIMISKSPGPSNPAEPGSNQTSDPTLTPESLEEITFIRGANYVSWTSGEFPFTTSWKPQDYFDSQAITKTAIKSGINSFDDGYLELTVELEGKSDNKRQGEVFTDLRYPSIYQGFIAFEAPVNFEGKVLSCMVYCPTGSGGNKYTPSGVQLFLKSVKLVNGEEIWSSFYGNWHNIWVDTREWTADKQLGDVIEGKWSIVAIDLAQPPLYGYVDENFDPTQVVLIGLKVGLNRVYNGDFAGEILVDNFGWGTAGLTGNEDIDKLPLDINVLENPKDNYLLFEKRVSNEVLFTFEQTENPLDILKRTGHNTISIVPTQYMVDKNAVLINPAPGKTNSDTEVEELIQLAKSRGLQVFLKPHVDVLDGTWRGEITPANIDEWFSNYTKFVVHYAEMAQKQGVDCLIIGTEFKTLQGLKYRDNWLGVITSAREVYSGFLSYAANWDDYWQVSFWDALDFVSIDAYFPLSDQRDPTLEELVRGWEEWKKELADFAKETQKVIVFSELGYRSTDYATREPWEYQAVRPFNEDLQKRCFQAALEALKNETWFGGFLIWNWSPKIDYGGRFNLDFTTQHKSAESIFLDFQSSSKDRVILQKRKLSKKGLLN